MLDNYSYKKLFRNKANVPADLQSAGIEYKDLLIRLKYRCFTKVRNEK